jgi:hypothetical protein
MLPLFRSSYSPRLPAVSFGVARAFLLGIGLAVIASAAPSVPPAPIALDKTGPVSVLNVTNNHPFAVRELISIPVEIRSAESGLLVEQDSREGAAPRVSALQVRREGERAFGWLDVALAAGDTTRFVVRSGQVPHTEPVRGAVVATAFASGLPQTFRLAAGIEMPAFDLLVLEETAELDTFADNRDVRVRRALAAAAKNPLQFRQTSAQAGTTVSEFRYEAQGGRANEYRVSVTHRVQASGTLDTEVTVRTLTLRTAETYLAIAKIFPAKAGTGAVIRWKGEIVALPAEGASPPRTVRSAHWSRDVSWIALGAAGGGKLSQPLLARNVYNLAREHRGILRNANDFQVNELAVGTADGWALLSEIARDQTVMTNYIPVQFVPPAPGESVVMDFRLLAPGAHTAQSIDQAFTAYAGHQGASLKQPGEVNLDFGVRGVQFGTSFFPNSTYGQNFEFWRSAGMIGGRLNPKDLNRDWSRFKYAYLFKEEMRRDLRIANAMGLDWIRIHHFDAPDFRTDYLQTEKGKWMLDFLDFFVGAAREAGLGIFLDFALSPNDIAFVARTYGDVIRYYEIQNEVLINPGARLDYFDYWQEVRDRIEQERPGSPVLITGAAQFFGVFDELDRRGITFNTTGQHCYVDRRELPAHFRDNAVGLGGYASRKGTHALNSEFNWRMITRETEEAQGAQFTELATHLFESRSMPLALQFHFQETFCSPPRTRGALRHYDPLRFDRTPKPQALAYMDIIRKFGTPQNRLHQLQVQIDEVRLQPGQEFTYAIALENVSPHPIALTIKPQLPSGFVPLSGEVSLELRPGEKRVLSRQGRAAADLPPGVYHIFEEIRYPGEVHFGWGIGRHIAAPALDLKQPLLKNVTYDGGLAQLAQIDLSTVSAAVFGEDAPALEVEWALYIYQTLRSATGAPVTREKETTLPLVDAVSRNLVLVGTPESNPLIKAVEAQLPASFTKLRKGHGLVAQVKDPTGYKGTVWLIVTGADTYGVERAASDFLYRYWRFAKEAVPFRKGMPPVEGSWMGTEPERSIPRERTAAQTAASARSINLTLPAVIRVGQEFRAVAMDSAEPPGPAAGVRIGVYRLGALLHSAVANGSGEARFHLDEAGDYEIRVEQVPSSNVRFTISP